MFKDKFHYFLYIYLKNVFFKVSRAVLVSPQATTNNTRFLLMKKEKRALTFSRTRVTNALP